LNATWYDLNAFAKRLIAFNENYDGSAFNGRIYQIGRYSTRTKPRSSQLADRPRMSGVKRVGLREVFFNIALFLCLLLLLLIFIPCGLVVYLIESLAGGFED
jgi:hypothetical protein